LLAQPAIAAPGLGVESHPQAVVAGRPGATASLLAAAPNLGVPLVSLIAKDTTRRLRHFAHEQWTTITLVLIVIAATVAMMTNAVSVVAGLTGVGLPIVLLLLQEIRGRRG
jgi:hypothetical protein